MIPAQLLAWQSLKSLRRKPVFRQCENGQSRLLASHGKKAKGEDFLLGRSSIAVVSRGRHGSAAQ